MVDIRRTEFVSEMNRYRQAISQTDSKYLKRDYWKKLKKMEKDLAKYDKYHKG